MMADIIPTTSFDAQTNAALWLIVLVSIGLLGLGADRLVTAAAELARALGVPKIIIGATIVSLGTTTPEVCVSVAAAFKGNADLALGNAVGSIIVDTGLIFGLCCLLKPLPMDRFVLNRHGWLQTGAGLLLTALCLGLWARSGDIHNVVLPRAAGILLVTLLVGYLYLSARGARQHPQGVPEAPDVPVRQARQVGRVAKDLLILAVGLGMVVLGSETLIGSVRVICERNHVPPSVLAVTLVAFGTSVPELVTGLAAILKGHGDISVGNIVGADILNVLSVTGLSAIAAPLRVEPVFFYLHLPAMMVMLLLFRGYILGGRQQFHRWQGAVLLAAYAAFVVLTVTVTQRMP
jgi:cation:H+ antiporter